jgi:hypothetical protein
MWYALLFWVGVTLHHQISAPEIGMGRLLLPSPLQLWTCHQGSTFVSTIWYTTISLTAISVVLTIMMNMKMVAPDDQWILMDHF